MLQLTVALSLIVYASACCFPDEWEATIGLNIGTYNMTTKQGQLIEGGIHIAYDFKNKMIGEHQYLSIDEKPFQQDVVLDYKTKLMFVIKNGTCEKYRLNDFPQRCFSDSAESSSTFTYGFGTNSVTALGYRFEVNQSTVYMAVDSVKCAPLSTDTITRMPPLFQVQVASYSNVTARISDRGIFNVPTACATVSTIHEAIPGLSFGKRSTLM